MFAPIVVLALFVSADPELERVVVAPDGRGFILETSKRPFRVWGVNYDHDEKGRLLEDYWFDEWEKVEADFGEIKELGANVVRVHLQTGRFLRGPDEPDEKQLAQLERLLKLAERLGLRLDLTGLACYHKADVPAWFDALDEAARWRAQARFWRAVAERGAKSRAVFCYDLMNEPVVPGGTGKRDDWLGPAFGDKHFVQFVALETRGRARPDVARAWVREQAAAVRQADPRGLVTVGLVDWSLDRPGLTSGFVPTAIAEELDFLAVHIYPEAGKVDAALETLAGFQVGKPVVIEETFPLRASSDELEQFFDRAVERGHAAGFVSFYWGRPPSEKSEQPTLAEAITADWLRRFQARSAKMTAAP